MVNRPNASGSHDNLRDGALGVTRKFGGDGPGLVRDETFSVHQTLKVFFVEIQLALSVRVAVFVVCFMDLVDDLVNGRLV